jgi:hypothetical protein
MLIEPSAQCAMRVVRTLPPAWSNNHTYQNVTATVVMAS